MSAFILPTSSAPASVAQSLTVVLADVVGAEQVSPDAHFFDDLGADSMLMARFCARVRKRPDLPSVSMKDVYQHPSVASLAAAFAPPDPLEGTLAEVLAEVVSAERVSPDAHFFDDLGADSMLMARFCARARKRADLPSVSMPDIYKHPTIRSLAAALAKTKTDTKPTPASQAATPAAFIEPPSRARNGGYVLCGALQLLFMLGYPSLTTVAGIKGFEWVYFGGSDLIGMYLRSVALGSAMFLGLCTLPILLKWVLVGRWKPQEIRIWSMAYFRFWVVKTLIQRSPMALFVGSPLYAFYLRALGAEIGRGAVILSKNVPVCTDLLSIGDGAVIRKDSLFTGYRAHNGIIQMGAVSIGKGALVGEVTVLDIWTSLGDGAQLGHSSSLHGGQAVPDGEHWHGSPAQRTDVDYQWIPTTHVSSWRRVVFATVQLVNLLVLGSPLAFGVMYLALTEIPQLAALMSPGPVQFTSWTFYRDALVGSAVLFFGAALVGLVFVGTVPRLLNLAITPDKVYPLYGFHYWAQRAIARTTNIAFYTRLFGDSSYIIHYLRWLGYDLRGVQQTGSNFGEVVRHDTPFLSAVGSGTMVADGLSIINADFSNTSFRLSRVSIGAHNFLGNNIAYPAQGKTGDNCLLATKLMVPVDGEMREGVGLLGAPSFDIPRSVERDKQFGLGSADELRRGLLAKNIHNTITMALYLLVRWIFFFTVTVLYLGAIDVWASLGALAIVLANVGVFFFTVAYWVLVDRLFRPLAALRPQGCSIYDRAFWRHERSWKVPAQTHMQVFNGTPLKNVIWRLLGVRIGRRVFDDGCYMSERTFVTIGDSCTLNAGSVIQCHSQEDRGFKSDRTVIGAGSTLGVGVFVLYGVTMGDNAVLAADSFLMKGSEIPARARWSGNPAGETIATGPVTPPVRETPATVTVAPPAAERPSPTRRTQSVPPVPRDDHVRRPRRRTVTTPATEPRDALTEPGRAFWQGALAAGGGTALRRWTLDPVPGVAEHEAPIPRETVVAARRLAYDLGVPLRSLLLAAHARVLAALSGERDVVVGYLAHPVVRPLPCLLSTEPASWRELVRQTRRTESALRAYAGFPVDDLRRELGMSGPSFETVFDPDGTGEVSGDTVLHVCVPEQDGRRTLRLRYRTDVLDAACAARIAGYHLTALAQVLADPDAEHRPQSLLSADELHLQLEGFAGPTRRLPSRRAHELFEQQVAANRGAVAAVHGDRRWTYRALNSRANRMARALRARGLRREDVVAVVTERNLDWMASVIAVFKAGGVYLPVEPHFPADRIAATLSRAACRLVLTEPGSTASLDRALDALPGIQKLLVDDACGEGHADTDLGVDVAADQLAYIYFTSGSTGEPKGAMCEHAGMLNHLLAKIEDLGIGQGQVVAQTAPQCFDISLWQLFSALLVGGRTLLVEQEAVLDVERFVDIIDEGRVAVLQVVPPYLEAVLAYLEQHPRPLPHLQIVSATGEALKKELVQRWFAARPGIPLVNAYGLTETSDDTNHEVMCDVPDLDRVPLGRPIRNALVSVVDEHLSPVPLGGPGEIVFSGVCVGRGYVNDPERTRAAFTTDPHRPGARLYRSGDRGRWLPDGRLEYIGRRDNQVKISGFRIEIGEIENTLLRLPGVRDAAVVVAERADRSRRLVAFHAGQPLDADLLTARLALALPAYMVPSAFHHRRDGLPVTGNGKIDRKALTALAAELDVLEGTGGDGDGPATPTERRLAAAWAEVLGVPCHQVGRRDHFFDRGGTSLSAVKLAIALNRAVSPKDLMQTPVLADLARLLDGKRACTAPAASEALP